MNEAIEFNVNDKCYAKMSPFGLAILRDIWGDYVPGMDEETGVYTAQIWVFMETFGPHMHMGMTCILFDGNNIHIELRNKN